MVLFGGFDAYNRVICEAAATQQVLLIEGTAAAPAYAAHFNDSVHLIDSAAQRLAKRVSQDLLGAAALREFAMRL